jgi:hypothetical protein
VEALASGSWLTRERVTRIAAISAIAGAAMLLFLWLAGHGNVDAFGQPIGSDFTAFWSAGRIANAGHAASAYDPAILNADLHAAHGVDYSMAWVYPPTFLFVASPLARLPYLAALLLWQALSLGAVALVLSAILKDSRASLIALASPLTPMVLAGGQNAFLSAALLGAGLIQLDKRPGVAGGIFGALTYKPQLGLGIAPLLLIQRNWRAIAAAVVMTLTLIAVSALLWGTAAWAAFPQGLANGRTWMEQGTSDFYKSASLFSAARLWGASIPAAYAVQALGLLGGLFLVWRTNSAPPGVRNAAVCAAIALSTPYLMDYDMATAGLGAAFLYVEARRTGFARFERSLLALIWIAPWFSRPAAEYLALPLGPLANALLAAMCIRRARYGITIPPLTCSVCPVT